MTENQRWGATPDEWTTFDMVLGLTRDMLPVVANPGAAISPSSKMRGLGKTPSTYNAQGYVVGMRSWPVHITTSEDIDSWSSNPDYSLCLIGREAKAIDGDITDKALALRVRALIESHLPGTAQVRTRNNSPKFLIMFRLPVEMMKRVIQTEHGIIEFLGDRQQFLAAGTHESGVRYEWEGLDYELVTLTVDQFEAIWGALEKEFATEPSVTAKAPKQLTEDPVMEALQERGLVLSHDREGQTNITCPFADEHTGASSESSTSYWPAHTGGYSHPSFKCLHAHCAKRTTPDFLAALGFDGSEDFEDITEEVAERVHLDNLITDDWVPLICSAFAQQGFNLRWLVDQVIPFMMGGIGVIVGPPGSGKTFIQLDLAFAIARGALWRGRRVDQGSVLYVAAEAAYGVRMRVQAYLTHNEIPDDTVPFYILDKEPNMLKKKDVDHLIAVANKIGGIKVIMLDTLAAVTVGGDENSGESMGIAISNGKRLSRETGALVIFGHHTGKDTSRGTRGHSSLPAACDFILEVQRNGDARSITTSKQKDGSDGAELGFRLLTVVIGQDDFGADITSCVVEHVSELPTKIVKKKKMGVNMKLVLECLQEHFDSFEEWPSVAEIVNTCRARELSSSNAYRAMDALKDKGVIEEVDGSVRIV
jgi:hypothetical protein